MLLSMLIRSPTLRPVHEFSRLGRALSRSVNHSTPIILAQNGPESFVSLRISSRQLSDAKNQQPSTSKENCPVEVEKQTDLERIREMQKYFEQYTEEYVEVEPELEGPSEKITKSDRLRQRLDPLLDRQQHASAGPFSVKEIVNILRAERVEDIVCIKVPLKDAADKYVIICTPHNMRHGEALVMAIRKCFKLKTDCQVEPPKKAKVGRWLCYNFENIALHMMSSEARLKYDLEILWGVGWEETLDDELDIPTPEQFPAPALS